MSVEQRAQLRDRRQVGLPELREALAILRCVLALDVEQVVADEDAGEVHVGAQPPQLRVDVVMMGVELIELRIDVLRLARRGQHRHHDQQQQTAESERRHGPRFEPHLKPPNTRPVIPSRLTPFGPRIGIP